MLFLAVFCGFMAENEREHFVERNREKEYIQSLLEDMQEDTSELNDEIHLAISQLEITDTLIDIISNRKIGQVEIDSLYVLHYSSRLVGPYFEDRTSSQLKNAGGMRLIHKKDVADSLSKYWHSIKLCETMTQLYESQYKATTELSVRIFNSKYIVTKEVWDGPSLKHPGATFIRNDFELLAEYGNRATMKRNLLRIFIERMEITRNRAIGVMKVSREQYHLK